ncbi:MAG TPA: hypothetical protein VER08_05065 [Pyrinomonadaceae bacterium]|nr:hypothetical protein [Pyrinomonadaceae bacterium]
MPFENLWLIRALVARLREPDMGAQRRFMAVACVALVLFLIGALTYLLRQPNDSALESAALRVFAAMGALIAVLVTAAVYVGRRHRP